MTSELRIRVGQCSDKGRKEVNQDFHGFAVPPGPQRRTKGVAIALADGIGSSQVSQVASEFAVMGFLDDYYCTSESWTVKKSVERVLAATNSWLHSRTRQSQYRYDKDRGYVCTLSALVIKGTTAHVFHVGDTRVYRLQSGALEQLTEDHRVWVSGGQSYLARAIGFNAQLEIDYQALRVHKGDVFVLASDGVYEHAREAFIAQAVRSAADDLDAAARAIVAHALERGSPDNLTVQIVVVDEVPEPDSAGLRQQLGELSPAPLLQARMELDGFRIVRELHGSHRSHTYLAEDVATGSLVALKTPSIESKDDPAYLERFLAEEWIARRINSAHVLKPHPGDRERSHLYVVMEYVEGQTLAQWMRDNPRPSVETVRGIVEQVARGLQAFHRMEMLHQDLRPENIMVDRTGTVKIIDFGAVSVAGLQEMGPIRGDAAILGTQQYAAPEYFLGEAGTPRSDIFSLGVIAYQMLCGRLPYGSDVSRATTRAAQGRLQYASAVDDDREIPAWVDGALRKAVHPNPHKRYATLSELTYDLRHPNPELAASARTPLIERHPVRFWKAVSALLAVALFLALAARSGGFAG